MTLRVWRLGLIFEARDAVRWPAPLPGNTLRGAFGLHLRAFDEAAYQRIFAPRAEGGPSGLADPPRPFVLRARELAGRRFEPGQRFGFAVHVFDESAVPVFVPAFAAVGEGGVGPGRSRVALVSSRLAMHRFDLAAAERAEAAALDFPAPLELKPPAPRPEFAVLFARLRDRIAALASLYQGIEPDVDFKGLGERAAAVALTRCDLRFIDAERHSGRTGQTHPLGGLTGTVSYAGELGEFLPWLRAGEWTGVGRQTVWGKGEYRVVTP